MAWDIDPHRVAAHPFVASLLGALVALRFAPGVAWLDRVINVGAGSVTAGYLAPAASELFGLTTAVTQNALAFAIGMFGMSIAAAVVQAIRELRLAEIISGWISRRGG